MYACTTPDRTHLVGRGECPEDTKEILTLHGTSHFLALAVIILHIPQLLFRIQDPISHIPQLLLGRGREPKHLAGVAILGRGEIRSERFPDIEDLFQHGPRGSLHIVEIDTIGFGWSGEFVKKAIEVGKVGRDDVFEEMEQVLAV
jgi:hypothetical protein